MYIYLTISLHTNVYTANSNGKHDYEFDWKDFFSGCETSNSFVFISHKTISIDLSVFLLLFQITHTITSYICMTVSMFKYLVSVSGRRRHRRVITSSVKM